MISSVFGKTKPINYIIVLVFLFTFYSLVHFFLLDQQVTSAQFLTKTLVLAVLLFSVFLIHFIVSRNKITEGNSYAILFFAVLVVLFPESIADRNAILCNFFMLLAIRRIISIKSLKEVKHKVFDATLWILIASLFYDWALMYLVLVFIAIYFYDAKNIRNWTVPLVSVATFLLLIVAIMMLTGNQNFLRAHYVFSLSLPAGYFFDWVQSLKWMLYFLCMSSIGITVFSKTAKLGLGRIMMLRLLVVFFYLGMMLHFLETENPGAPLMLTFFPAAIFLNNFIDTLKKPRIKELALTAFTLIPFLVFVWNIAFP
ncbi:hypothetical protein U1E44_10070 [Arenibacter sp. GZD96]|uniref:hypothetical protein n=1 Tax=Aurantibrevibacter litoralis TaxID=3106030 RepID=UPI002AFFE54B|nr:hypothetical protein [Arenibacter sp. GZD-96]MEA1786438.1 hypothetical protein [Arenibacter sp. GZD-96]